MVSPPHAVVDKFYNIPDENDALKANNTSVLCVHTTIDCVWPLCHIYIYKAYNTTVFCVPDKLLGHYVWTGCHPCPGMDLLEEYRSQSWWIVILLALSMTYPVISGQV